MTVSIRRMSAGAGYQYLLRSVVAGDGDRALRTPLTRYFHEAGTPPGRWMGSSLSSFGAGQLQVGMVVSEAQLALLLGMGRDPVTGDQLGQKYLTFPPKAARVKERVDALDPEMTLEDCAAETARIEAEEALAGTKQPVAGFDLTFSAPKSVSVLWGVADARTQERIVAAHHAAVADVLGFFEREVAATRTGVAAGDGAVAQVEVAGVAAAAYDHYDSRSGDPQLHTHLVVSNKVLTLLDGRWRSLDGRPVFASVTALSAQYNALLADRLTRELGVGWELRQRGADRNPQWEINGVGERLIREFSSRSRDIDLEKDKLIEAYRATHGRMPSAKTIVALRAQATVATRPPKEIQSLSDLTASWRKRAEGYIDADPTTWVTGVVDHQSMLLTAEDVAPAVEALAESVVAKVSVKRATWTHWNLLAEASKQTMDLRFATTADREAVVGLIAEAAEQQSINLTPPETGTTPASFRRADGTSVFRPKHANRYTSAAIMEAEARLLRRAGSTTGPIAERAGRETAGASREQADAVGAIARSGRVVDVLVGAAGSGKTTTMRALRTVWEQKYGPGSVIGLAPSATAAHKLAEDLGIGCENTAKWQTEHSFDRAQLRFGQLVIIDEASLADTRSLDYITAAAETAGAKVVLVGDDHQLGAVDAGGAFALLASSRVDTPELLELHRFNHQWEKQATLALRRGDERALITYQRAGRIREGTTAGMLDAAYTAWRRDLNNGETSILIAESAQAVSELNARARADRITREGVGPDGREIELADGNRACVGDLVLTRKNDRTLRSRNGHWVKNGDQWRIAAIRPDGRVEIVPPNSPGRVRRRGTVVLPATYVRDHLDLGYALTAHRAQGLTVATAHALVSSGSTKEGLYVAMSRGSQSNTAYVALDHADDSHASPPTDHATGMSVLVAVMRRSGSDASAHAVQAAEYATYNGIARQAAELEMLAAEAQHDRFSAVLRDAGLTEDEHSSTLASSSFGPLGAGMRRAEAEGFDLTRLLRSAVAMHDLDDARDVAAVLHERIGHLTQRRRVDPTGSAARFIAGLVPEPMGPMSDEYRRAVRERSDRIESYASDLLDAAEAQRAPWVRLLGNCPPTATGRAQWMASALTIAAYRNRYAITSDAPLGGPPQTDAQELDRARAVDALSELESLDGPATPTRAAMSTRVIDLGP